MRYAPSAPVRPAMWTCVLLVSNVLAVTALAIFEATRGQTLMREIAAMGGMPRESEGNPVVGAVTVFALLVLLATGIALTTAGSYLGWLWRARQTIEVYGLTRPRFSRGWAIAVWFVPLVNLVLPPLIVHDVWRGSSSPRRLTLAPWLTLLTCWWASCLVTVWTLVFSRGPLLTGTGHAQAASVLVSALLCGATIWEITRAQQMTTDSTVRLDVPAGAGRRGLR
ncbi:DUF4328 domain-containing protein [Rhizohabitans arisaemae]|uniref:DUF4328 domain-containing protein n=1 Tax=Rhizohabitans arisaemae TaxID=2720610 RepID=UPI0024B03CCF|nr:DUF4328 domain-containing protein [Rhizohabitans arisaemae]